jgi:hypothetical protein
LVPQVSPNTSDSEKQTQRGGMTCILITEMEGAGEDEIIDPLLNSSRVPDPGLDAL